MAPKRTYDDDNLVSSSDDEKKKGTSAESKQKHTGSLQQKIAFKESWKANYSIKAVPNDKYKFPWKKSFLLSSRFERCQRSLWEGHSQDESPWLEKSAQDN